MNENWRDLAVAIGAGKHGEGGNDLVKMQCQLGNERELLVLEAPWKGGFAVDDALERAWARGGHTQREDTRGNMQELE